MNQPTLFDIAKKPPPKPKKKPKPLPPEPPEADSWPPLKRFILAWFPNECGQNCEATAVQVAAIIARQRHDEKRTTPDGLSLDIFEAIGNLLRGEYLESNEGWLTITDKGLAALGKGEHGN